MFWVLAEHLAPEPIQPDGQYVCSDNVGTQSRLAPARVAVQIGGQRESELHRGKKILISVHFVYENTCVRVCVRVRVGGGGGADIAGSI